MKLWSFNPNVYIEPDTYPTIRFTNKPDAFAEPVTDLAQIEALYRIASEPQAVDFEHWCRVCGSRKLARSLIEAEILVASEARSDADYRQISCSPISFLKMSARSPIPRFKKRDRIFVYDNVFSEQILNPIAITLLQLSYRRVDIDKDKSSHLHWIHRFSPPNLCVRAIPFLRFLDGVVRASFGQSCGEVIRVHSYLASSEDVFMSHRDSDAAGLLTAVFYPSAWQEEYGGELMFYKNFEPDIAVACKRNRLVVFPSNKLHRIGAIGPTSPGRVSLVIRYGSAI